MISTIEELLSELAEGYVADYYDIASGIVYYEKSLAQVIGRLFTQLWPTALLFVAVLVDRGRAAQFVPSLQSKDFKGVIITLPYGR